MTHAMDFAAAEDRLRAVHPLAANADFWAIVRENCTVVEDAAKFVPMAFGDIEPMIADEDRDFIAAAGRLLPEGEMTAETWGAWTGALKAETGRKGKGLFMPLRLALTGRERGPSVGDMLVLMGRDRAAKRLS